MRKITPHTPLGQLILERQELERLCTGKEQKLMAEWRYIRLNAGRLLLPEIISLFFRRPQMNSGRGRSGGSPAVRMVTAMVWRMLRPLLLQWMTHMGWHIVKNMFTCRRSAE